MESSGKKKKIKRKSALERTEFIVEHLSLLIFCFAACGHTFRKEKIHPVEEGRAGVFGLVRNRNYAACIIITRERRAAAVIAFAFVPSCAPCYLCVLVPRELRAIRPQIKYVRNV